jgi:predicted kinase
MLDIGVVLIGGTSNVGKSTVADEVAARLRFERWSTDSLARHPGRPWRTDGDELPPHAAEHYRDLTVDSSPHLSSAISNACGRISKS